MKITKDSRIVEIFSTDMLKREVANKDEFKNELKDANIYIKELASSPSPERRYEIAQILSKVISEGLEISMYDYLDLVGDVERTGMGERVRFHTEIDGLKAFWQAKSATTERSTVSSKSVTMDTDEVSIRPVVNFLDLQYGRVDLSRLAAQATVKMENAIVQRIQQVIYEAFKNESGVNYAAGAGIAKQAFDPILHAMTRVGGGASIIGDIEALSKFTALAGYNGDVPAQYQIEHNENGMIGTYNGASLVKLNNPFQAGSLTETELRKDLVFVMPNVDDALKPVKIQIEGDVQSIDAPVNIDSKQVEFKFDQYVGVGVIGARKLLGVYEDTSLA